MLVAGCAGQTDKPTTAAAASTTTVAPTTTTLPPLTAKELAWLKAVPTVSKKIEDLGATVAPAEGAQFAQFITEDLARWTRVARERNLSAK